VPLFTSGGLDLDLKNLVLFTSLVFVGLWSLCCELKRPKNWMTDVGCCHCRSWRLITDDADAAVWRRWQRCTLYKTKYVSECYSK